MIIVVTGPTGSGKSDLSIKLAKRYNGIIINADSMQVYREMNIATAKITDIEKDNVPHYLLDIKNFDEDYSVFDYQNDGRELLDEYKDRNIIIVGGTGLYIKALLFDYRFNVETGETNDYHELSNQELYDLCLEKDPKMDIHVNNRKRLIRFLNKELGEVVEPKLLYPNVYFIGLTMDRDKLYERLDKRVDIMVNNGLVEEAKYFYDKQVDCKSLNTVIGYKELFKYFNSELSLEEAIESIKKNTRHYAKRQYTFFNNQFELKWFNVLDSDYQEQIINYIEKQ